MLRFAASLNMMFDDSSMCERVEQAALAGFEGVEVIGLDLDMYSIAEQCRSSGIQLDYISGEHPPLTDPNGIETAVHSIETSIELASETGCPKVNVSSGPKLSNYDEKSQFTAIRTVLNRVSQHAESAGVTLVLEGINSKVDSPDQFLNTADSAAKIVREVGSKNVDLLFDFYHEQISSGDVIRSFKNHAGLVGHVQIADNPGRHEPGTGELNYHNILSAVVESNYNGVIGCEYSPTVSPKCARSELNDLTS